MPGEGSSANREKGTLVGEQVAGLDIVGVLGAGAMGEIYLARHRSLGVQRAVKVIHDDHLGDGEAHARFRREAMALSQLQHHNVVQIIDFGRLENGWPYLCMEYIEGKDLDDQLEERGPLPLDDALQVLAQLARALAYAHSQGVVHRDLKPANVILRQGDPRQVKIIDFGLARMISKEKMTRITAEQHILGTPLFMAPEQANGSLKITGAADVYALAGIAYAILSGEPVFLERQVIKLIAAHADEEPQRLSARVPQIPELLDALLYAGLSKSPGDRPSAEELAAHLEKMFRSAGGGPPAASDAELGMTLIGGAAADLSPRDPLAAARAAGSLDDYVPLASAEPAHEEFGSIQGSPRPEVPVADGGGVQISESFSDEVTKRVPAHDISDLLIDRTGAEEPDWMREALVNQATAIIGELASLLAVRDAEVARLQREVDQRQDAVTQLEMELAVLDSQVAELAGGDLGGKNSEREMKAARCGVLRRELKEAQRALFEAAARRRDSADSELRALHEEFDVTLAKLRAGGDS